MISMMSNKLDGLNDSKTKNYKKLKLNKEEFESGFESSSSEINLNKSEDSGGSMNFKDTSTTPNSGDQRILDAVDTLVSLANSTTTTPTSEFKSFTSSPPANFLEQHQANSNIEIVSYFTLFFFYFFSFHIITIINFVINTLLSKF